MQAETRRRESFYAKRPAESGYNPRMPRKAVLREAADSQAFWYQELLEPARLYVRASGFTAVPVHRIYDEVLQGAGAEQGVTKAPKIRAIAASDQPKRKREYCFSFDRQADGCSEPCLAGRSHACEGCGAANVRSVNCCYKHGPLAKKVKGKGKGKNKKGSK